MFLASLLVSALTDPLLATTGVMAVTIIPMAIGYFMQRCASKITKLLSRLIAKRIHKV